MSIFTQFSHGEVIALWSVLGTAILGLLYAFFLMGQVLKNRPHAHKATIKL